MYVSLVLLYLGFTLIYRLAWPLVLLPAVMRIIRLRVIRAEEQTLARRFGDEYTRYAQRVRRWI
jgi:protein-S-isoprenylcysteine O-methyltransferase Ste14